MDSEKFFRKTDELLGLFDARGDIDIPKEVSHDRKVTLRFILPKEEEPFLKELASLYGGILLPYLSPYKKKWGNSQDYDSIAWSFHDQEDLVDIIIAFQKHSSGIIRPSLEKLLIFP